MLVHFDDDASGDAELVDISEYTFVYNNYVSTDAGIACCYNISDSLLKSEKIERIMVKTSDEKELDIVSDLDALEDYTNLCNEVDFYQLISKLQTTSQMYVVAWESFVSGKDVEVIDKMPVVQTLKNKEFEVLYLTDEVDEFVMQTLMNYKEKTFRNAAQGDLDLDTEEEKEALNKSKEETVKKKNPKEVVFLDEESSSASLISSDSEDSKSEVEEQSSQQSNQE